MTIDLKNFLDQTSASRTPDQVTVPFKKHRGKTVMELAREDAGYLRWARNATDWGDAYCDVIDDALMALVEEKITAAPPIELTPHQEKISSALLDAVQPGSILSLNGGAGYGKSFVTKKLATELSRLG